MLCVLSQQLQSGFTQVPMYDSGVPKQTISEPSQIVSRSGAMHWRRKAPTTSKKNLKKSSSFRVCCRGGRIRRSVKMNFIPINNRKISIYNFCTENGLKLRFSVSSRNLCHSHQCCFARIAVNSRLFQCYFHASTTHTHQNLSLLQHVLLLLLLYVIIIRKQQRRILLHYYRHY